ncbi:MAG: hypothetical protein MJ252_13050, partial [archaeon]|nr:hypothetical protein [archaeon]
MSRNIPFPLTIKRNIQFSPTRRKHSSKSPDQLYSDKSVKLLLSDIYKYINKSTSSRIDKYTIQQITNLPLIVSEKLVLAFSSSSSQFNKEDPLLTLNNFIDGFFTLYHGEIKDKVKLIYKICNYNKKNIIDSDDVKILLYHLHFKFMTEKKEKKILNILNTFFKEKETFTEEEFLEESLNKN